MTPTLGVSRHWHRKRGSKKGPRPPAGGSAQPHKSCSQSLLQGVPHLPLKAGGHRRERAASQRGL